jgi:hypothetical protein
MPIFSFESETKEDREQRKELLCVQKNKTAMKWMRLKIFYRVRVERELQRNYCFSSSWNVSLLHMNEICWNSPTVRLFLLYKTSYRLFFHWNDWILHLRVFILSCNWINGLMEWTGGGWWSPTFLYFVGRGGNAFPFGLEVNRRKFSPYWNWDLTLKPADYNVISVPTVFAHYSSNLYLITFI